MSKEFKTKINQILIDYELVKGKPLKRDIVDKILELFGEKKEKWQEEQLKKIKEIFKKISKRIEKQKRLVQSYYDVPKKEQTKYWKLKLFQDAGELNGWRYCRDLFQRELRKLK